MALLSLIAKLGLDKTGFEAGLNSAGKKVSAFGSDLKSQLAGAFGAAAVIAFTKSAIQAASRIGDLADRLGVSTDAAQQFSLAAATSGSDVEAFAAAFEKLRVAQDKALKGGDAGPFAALGISVGRLKALSPQELFEALADSIDDIGTNTAKLNAMMEVFGAKGAGKVISMLQDFEKAKQNAALISPADIKAAQAFDDAWTTAIANAKASVVGFLGWLQNQKPSDIPKWMFIPTAIRHIAGSADETPEQQQSAGEISRMEALLRKKAKEREEVERIEALAIRIQDVDEKNRQAGLTAEQKLTEAKEKQLELANKLAEINAKPFGDMAEQAKALLALREQEGIVAALERGIKPDAVKSLKGRSDAISSDSLGRIGGRIGGGSPMQSELQKHTRELQKINQRMMRGIKLDTL